EDADVLHPLDQHAVGEIRRTGSRRPPLRRHTCHLLLRRSVLTLHHPSAARSGIPFPNRRRDSRRLRHRTGPRQEAGRGPPATPFRASGGPGAPATPPPPASPPGARRTPESITAASPARGTTPEILDEGYQFGGESASNRMGEGVDREES